MQPVKSVMSGVPVNAAGGGRSEQRRASEGQQRNQSQMALCLESQKLSRVCCRPACNCSDILSHAVKRSYE